MKNYTVWVGGSEINSHYLTKQDAESIAQEWVDLGYDDVILDIVK
jgi:hypothetical protein